MPDCVVLASFVANCVFIDLAPMTQNVLAVWPIKKPFSSLASDVTGSKLLEVYICVATSSVDYRQTNVVKKK